MIEEKQIGIKEDGTPWMVRAMTPEQEKERYDLNAKNTTEAKRRKVVEELAKYNGGKT